MKNVPYALLAAAVLSSLQANAAGFQVAETSASGLGRAFSGEAAVADNASVLARNPAALTRFKLAATAPTHLIEIPCNLCSFLDFHHSDALIAYGYDATLKKLALASSE